MNDPDVEPVVHLITGTTVFQAVYESVTSLQSRGHTITVSNGDVFVFPPVDHDASWIVVSNWRDVQAVLESQQTIGMVH